MSILPDYLSQDLVDQMREPVRIWQALTSDVDDLVLRYVNQSAISSADHEGVDLIGFVDQPFCSFSQSEEGARFLKQLNGIELYSDHVLSCARGGETPRCIPVRIGNATWRVQVVGLRDSMCAEIWSDTTSEEHAKAELQSRVRELEQFAYVASHDLQAPLRHVEQFSTLLQNELELTEDQKVYFGFVVDGVARMRRQINDLLSWSRAGDVSSNSSVDLNLVVDEAKKRLVSLIEESDADIQVENLPTVIGDEGTLIQVFQNLINNSLKFRGNRRPLVRIASLGGDLAHITVTDNGLGIDNNQLDHIFELFSRLYPRDQYDGTGIGLAICRRVVDRHGGRIWAESKGHDTGTTFHVELPAHEVSNTAS